MSKLKRESVRRITSEFEGAQLGDPRRSQRLLQMVAKLAEHPAWSLPDAMGSEAELEGAYRFVNNPEVTLEALLAPHAAKTAERARQAGMVLAIHDTTPCACPHADAEEVGYLNTGKAGFYVHYALIVGVNSRLPLGVAHVEAVARKTAPRKPKEPKRKKLSGAQTLKKQNREFDRWENGIQRAELLLQGCHVVHVGDRETDSFQLLAANIAHRRRFVFRLRLTERFASSLDGERCSVHELATRAEGLFERSVQLSARQKKPGLKGSKANPSRHARTAKLSFSAVSVAIHPPNYHRSAHPEPLQLNVVRVWEPNPPEGQEPVEWVLYTTEPIETPEQVVAIVDIYRGRWLIEECNKALKTGCKIEEREFESRHAMLNMLATSLPIACEILRLRAANRETPTAPATDVISQLQLDILSKVSSRPPPSNATVHDALRAIAALAGHQKSNGEPGWLILQRGMSKLIDYEVGWRARGSDL